MNREPRNRLSSRWSIREYPFISALCCARSIGYSWVLFLILCFHHHLINQSAADSFLFLAKFLYILVLPSQTTRSPRKSISSRLKMISMLCYRLYPVTTDVAILFYSCINKKMILQMAFILSSDALMASDIRAT